MTDLTDRLRQRIGLLLAREPGPAELTVLDAIARELDQAGFAIVPKKLTPAMREQIVDWMSGGDATGDPDMAWSEALKAAPKVLP